MSPRTKQAWWPRFSSLTDPDGTLDGLSEGGAARSFLRGVIFALTADHGPVEVSQTVDRWCDHLRLVADEKSVEVALNESPSRTLVLSLRLVASEWTRLSQRIGASGDPGHAELSELFSLPPLVPTRHVH